MGPEYASTSHPSGANLGFHTHKQADRRGNLLLEGLKKAWDNTTLRIATKSDPLAVDNAHVTVVAHATPSELCERVSARDIATGLINRFLAVAVWRSQTLKRRHSKVPTATLEHLAGKLAATVDHARGCGEVGWSDDADESYDRWRVSFDNELEHMATTVQDMLSRGSAQVARLALIYALLDDANTIDSPHLLAALAVWDYAADSITRTLNTASGPTCTRFERDTRKLRHALVTAGHVGLALTDQSDIFHRNRSAGELAALRRTLEAAGEAVTLHDGRETRTYYKGYESTNLRIDETVIPTATKQETDA